MEQFPGADRTTVTIPDVQKSKEGRYRCIVSNNAGSTISKFATLTEYLCEGISYLLEQSKIQGTKETAKQEVLVVQLPCYKLVILCLLVPSPSILLSIAMLSIVLHTL